MNLDQTHLGGTSVGFFNKLLGRKKKKDDEDSESESEAGTEASAQPEPEPEPEPPKKPTAKAAAKSKPEPEPEPESEPESEPEPAAPTEAMGEISSSSDRGMVQTASGTIGSGSSGASMSSMSSGSLRAAPNMIQCDSCERDLPVPLASGVTVTCPFCLGRTAYKS